jgi:TIR domain
VNHSSMAHDVFISHAHKDRSIADAICEKLESAQVRCWIAARDVSASEDWTEATRKAIGSSHVMVLVLSENANAAPHIEREIAHAFYTGRSIIPFRLANTLPRRDFLFYLDRVRWFNAFSPPTEQHLEALTARIKSLVPNRTVNSNGLPLHGAIGTTTRFDFLNSRIGALQASHYRTLEIFKRVAIAASLFVAAWLVWLLCFAPRQTKHGAPLAESNLGSTSSSSGASADSSSQARGGTSVSKPTYVFSRFGLWKPQNTGQTPLAQQGPQGSPSTTPTVQPASPTPSPRSDVDQKAAGETKRLATHHSASAKSAQEVPTRIITPRQPAPASHYDQQQYQDPDRTIAWRSWQQLPEYEVRIRTGDRYLGGENWAHYLGFELAATSQKVIKVSLIHLEGETAADIELSPAVPDAIVKIVNHQMTVPKGAWGWALQTEPSNTGPTPLAQQGLQDTPPTTPAEQPASPTPSPRSDVDQKAAGEAKRLATQDGASVRSAQEAPTRIITPVQPTPAPHYDLQQYQDPDRTITWRSWQQLPAYEVRIRTGDHYLGGENWAHYLGFELAATSQKVIKVSLIHLEGETAADIELSPTVPDAIVKIVNHQMTVQKGAWGWALQEIKQSGP